ncbi:decarboxylase UbiD [Sulfolobus sp. A20]|uniref:UbiD family decarboxylase n=1 Tax=Saccharolobus sp. A20 TaxID=1891280 RepID=UPI0008461A38|nr:UbiD family decarboxylase [Sulfolobus sp. A20]TRM74174.1 UbiD family decarboxylase [Sulfolobus sp. A20-N-F8]TRM75542.1 UbiD family decarboxylase [Sulfolobus sp. E5]TRM78476.1 UbiD family decarboxylase [Sulfolobus sp. B5]TRM81412.1 UbiD family decarboxylase [Sulfolobus sp. D5]TRM82659.1 UbiD family decarboxylase [Sulfolobus sp. A20-N-F6]TRM85233.1 UbiD family decarboxylase [Sulfolobus sp. F3]TRM86990.1 UbiD family decarboxylase [Sulfolobus sp. C3]TRM88541.1 UbiD family decarboxylase [Sulf
MYIRKFIEEVRNLGLLKEVKGADWNLEIGAITDLNAKKHKFTLLFDEIKDYPKGFRVLTGALLDYKRVNLALNINALNDIDLVKKLRDRLNIASKEYRSYEPEEVNDAVFLENVDSDDKVNLFKFPAPKWHEFDGGRYIGTADAVITKDPESDWVNVGAYRVMLVDRNKLSIFIDSSHHGRIHVEKYLKAGKKCPIAISFSPPLDLFIFAGMEVPAGISEYNYAGAIVGKRFKVFRGEETGLPIPAESDIVIEGYISGELTDEGPFGEFMGYYAGGRMKNPVIEVKRVYYRSNPILLGTAPSIPPYDYSYFRCPLRSAMIWDMLERIGVRDIKGVWAHEIGFSRALIVVSIKQSFAGQQTMVGHILATSPLTAYGGRYVIVVDEDIDPSDINQVLWAICTRTDPINSIEIVKNVPSTPLDPMAERKQNVKEYVSSRAIIYATKPFNKDFPREVRPSEDIVERVIVKWREILE